MNKISVSVIQLEMKMKYLLMKEEYYIAHSKDKEMKE
jgi:hypothetical protein